MSKALKLLSTALEHMFKGLEHKFPRREKYFSLWGKLKFVEKKIKIFLHFSKLNCNFARDLHIINNIEHRKLSS